MFTIPHNNTSNIYHHQSTRKKSASTFFPLTTPTVYLWFVLSGTKPHNTHQHHSDQTSLDESIRRSPASIPLLSKIELSWTPTFLRAASFPICTHWSSEELAIITADVTFKILINASRQELNGIGNMHRVPTRFFSISPLADSASNRSPALSRV